VEREKGQALADQWMCPFFETSAKNSTNVDQVIRFLKNKRKNFSLVFYLDIY
jgi:hypothetical protein